MHSHVGGHGNGACVSARARAPMHVTDPSCGRSNAGFACRMRARSRVACMPPDRCAPSARFAGAGMRRVDTTHTHTHTHTHTTHSHTHMYVYVYAHVDVIVRRRDAEGRSSISFRRGWHRTMTPARSRSRRSTRVPLATTPPLPHLGVIAHCVRTCLAILAHPSLVTRARPDAACAVGAGARHARGGWARALCEEASRPMAARGRQA